MASGFEGFVLFGFMAIMLMLGTLLRAKIKLFQDYLVPAAIIGGLIGFAVVAAGNWLGTVNPDGTKTTALVLGGVAITHKGFNTFVFHAFNISFMSLLLTTSEKTVLPKAIVRGGMWQTCIWSISLGGQALVGGIIIWLYNLLSGGQLSELLGFLATHGYTQGPGQAFVMGSIWEKNGVGNAVTIGLIYAAMGFFTAVIVGVPIARWLVRKGVNVNKRASLSREFLVGLMDEKTNIPNGRETTHASNIDTLSYHLAILGVTYLLTYLELGWLQANVKPLFAGNKWLEGVGVLCSMPMFFVHGLMMGYFVRKFLVFVGAKRFMDPVVQTRITGASVDFLVVATLTAIEFTILMEYALPIFLVCLGVTLFTLWLVFFFGRRLGDLGPERLVTQFGCCCGSTASGILLLRILDPDFRTPVAVELGFFNVAILVTCAPILFLFAPIFYKFSFIEIVGIYVAFTGVMVALMYALKLVGKPQQWATEHSESEPAEKASASLAEAVKS